ncbi:MAG: hypothetical protein E7652_04075, partial [Ruminococcaceae bacterium]|nr:hypothetical protein [Oscillospiraceae bacterium]
MKRTKKILAVLLTLCMLLPLIQVGSLAASYTITFDADGGELVGPATYEVNVGDFYVDIFGEEAPKATLEGYNLVGWFCEKWNYWLDMSPTSYFAVNEDITFVAMWEEAPVVDPTPDPEPDPEPVVKDWTMYFDPDGGEMVGPTEYGINTGDFYADIFGDTIPQATYEGYVLIGWYLEKYNFTLTDGDVTGGGYYAVAEDSYFVALWEEAPVVDPTPDPEPEPVEKDWTMYFDPDGGEMVGPTEYGINTGDMYADIFGESIPQAILEGYVVTGWYAEKWNFTLTDGDITGGGYYAISEDCYFVAIWAEAP